MPPDRYDVIIAGAGPAGATCARACAKAGIRTLLLERDTFPRPKPCGGAVSERAIALLGLPLPPDIIERECRGARIHFRDHRVETRKDCRIAVMVSRERFDHYLADQAVDAGAVLCQDEPVQEVSVSKDRVEVRTDRERYEARCVVGADGANSIVGRAVRPLFARDEMAVALAGAVPAGEREIDDRLSGLLDMHFGVARMGHGWVFPHQGYFGVGVMGRASEFEDPLKVFSAFAASVGLPAPRPQGHTIPWGGFPRALIGPRILLAGDAAGLADPFHGEGIYSAVLSGKLAAQAVVEGIRGKKDTLPWYARECDRLIMKEKRIALRMTKMFDRHPRIFLELFFADTEALDRYLDIAAGRSDSMQFQSWLLKRLPRALAAMVFRGTGRT